jgi:hypothetical protein
MARDEQDRENLLAEATALVERVSLQIEGNTDVVLIGFRADDSASIYFGSEPVYQFTSDGRLRRALVDGLLFKAEHGRLVSLTCQRGANVVQLVRHELDERATRDFLADMRASLEALHHALCKGSVIVTGQVPEGTDLAARVRCWLDEYAGRPRIASSPRAC